MYVVVCWCFNEDGILPSGLVRLLDWLEPSLNNLLPNPFSEPPEAIVSRGMGAVRDYFKDLLQEEYIAERRDVKVVIIGGAEAGKTRYERRAGATAKRVSNLFLSRVVIRR